MTSKLSRANPGGSIFAWQAAQERTFLVDLEEFETVAAFGDDVHAAVVVGLGHGQDFRGAADVGEIRILCANYAERPLLLQALADHLLVPRLEDVKRQGRAGEQHDFQGEQGEQGIQEASEK